MLARGAVECHSKCRARHDARGGRRICKRLNASVAAGFAIRQRGKFRQIQASDLQGGDCGAARSCAADGPLVWDCVVSVIATPADRSHGTLIAVSCRSLKEMAGMVEAYSTTRHSNVGRGRREFGAPFQFSVRRDECTAFGAYDRLIVFQYFRIDQSGAKTNPTPEFIHHGTPSR
jgi:hypothetical protein